jgi:NadR type nicotinamide-nucleotide adenylyltransferase
MENLLSINTIIFTLWGYQMSYIEFVGTIFNLWCVWLAVKNKILTWPVGIVGIVLYIFLFYQIQLYSDLFEQIYFFFASFYGWWLWSSFGKKSSANEQQKELKITKTTPKENFIYIFAIFFGTVFVGFFMKNIHINLPEYFPLPAAFPYLDAFTTMMSFAAAILMAKRKIESWYLWIVVDIIGIWLYYQQGVKFIAIEYVIFLALAISGYLAWKKEGASIKKGLVLGKFAPFHKGHQSLVDNALKHTDKVYVMIYDCPKVIDIPLKTRAEWIRKIYPQVCVLEVPEGPPDSKEDPIVMRQHENFIKDHLPEPVTHLFSSEWYGDYVSKALGAQNIQVDPKRGIIPISGTAIRQDPHKHRDYLHPVVYRDFIKKIVFLGAESTGKTTLAEEMAKRFKTEWVAEYGREYWNKNNVGGKLSQEQLVDLALIHLQKEDEKISGANKYLFVDTNAITTEMFSRFYHGDAHKDLEKLAKENEDKYQMYFVCDIDIPYAEDGTRSGAEHRERFQKKIIEDLKRRGIPFVLLTGTLEQRAKKVEDVINNSKEE